MWEAALAEADEHGAAHPGVSRPGVAGPADDATAGRRDGPASLVRAAWMGLSAAEREDPGLAVLLETGWPGVTDKHSEPATHVRAASARTSAPSPPRVPDQDSDGILVDDAGLVLLHPFLPRFFEAVSVADGADLVDPVRALSLLHHLATGEVTAAEHQLTLPKALCEVPLEQPVPADVALTAAEMAEGNALLESVIHHWEALRGTSRDALRIEFLMRPGTLTADFDGGWLLRVEARTADILLDQLLWGTSMFQLPWMSHLMRVEWG